MTDALKRLSEEGVAIWLDDRSRKRITSGNLAELIDQQHVVGVTTNPSIFQKAISSGDGYEQQLADLAARKVTVEEAIRMITTADVRDAADIRHAATAEGILCLTAMETAVAAAEALDPAIAGQLTAVRSLAGWVPAEAFDRRGAGVPA